MTRTSRPNAPQEIPCEVNGKRRFSIWDCMFEVDEKYQLLKCIGKGAYGMVCSATDTTNDEKVAIKKITKPLISETNAIRCLREINLLRHLEHPNIIHLRGVMKPASYEDGFQDLYVLYECMDTDLHQIIRSKQPLSDDHYKYFIMQTLKGVKYLHSMGIIHRDLKPSNLLVNADCDLRIADFGLARSKNSRFDMTQYVITRWYRAPEVIMCRPYCFRADLWSVGCILAELLQGTPLFTGTSGGLKALQKIVEIIGRPAQSDLIHLNEKLRSIIYSVSDNGNMIDELFSNTSELCRDLLKSLLQFNPDNRPTAQEALDHPWFDDMREEEEEIDGAPLGVTESPFEFDFGEENLGIDEIRQLMIREIEYWNDNHNNNEDSNNMTNTNTSNNNNNNVGG
eukprot:g8875.t1